MNFVQKIKANLIRYFFSRRVYKFFINDWISLRDISLCAEVIKTMRFTRNLVPLLLDMPSSKRIVVVAPHPDDEILGPGGTLFKSIAGGAQVSCIYMTNGNAADEEELIAQSDAVASRWGYDSFRFGFHSGNIPLTQQVISKFAEQIKKMNPGALFIPVLLDDHDDHRRVNHLLWKAYAQGFLSGIQIEIWGYGVYTPNWPNVIVDVSDVAREKSEAIRMFKNQMRAYDWSHMALGLNAFNTRFLKKPSADNYVETFFVTPLKDYMAICERYFSDDATQVYYTKRYVS